MNRGYTKIPNELLDTCNLSIQARYLLCVLLRHNSGTGKCFPTQITLGVEIGRSTKQVRVILSELIKAKALTKRQRGFNRSNDYFISMKFVVKNLPATTAKNYGEQTKTYAQKKYKSSAHPNAYDLLNSKQEIVKDNIYLEKENEFSSKMRGFFDDLKHSSKNNINDRYSNELDIDEGENQKTKKPVSIREILDSKIKSAGTNDKSVTALMIDKDQVPSNSRNPTPAKTQSSQVNTYVPAYVDSYQEDKND